MYKQSLINQAQKGFQSLKVSAKYQQAALKFLEQWLTDKQFSSYQDQLKHLIKNKYWDYLLDCFYQVIPFGTGGRRGEVGIGPNRINAWTIQASAQGHSQYLIKKHGDEAKKRGIVLCFDIRKFFGNQFLSNELPNPVLNLSCKNLAQQAAEVYTANGIKVYLFKDFRTTPELSFAVRYLNAVGGDVFSASHNPPEHNGKKVYDEFGGQLIPPHDEQLVEEVTQNITQIKKMDLETAAKNNLLKIIGKKVDQAYFNACCKLSFSKKRDIKIVYTPLHGCGTTSIYPVLKQLNFQIYLDPKTSQPDPQFSNVIFNIPNPEVEQSFSTALMYAKKINADIILNSDPDADRVGIMVKHHNEWRFLNGNEIGAIITDYVIKKNKKRLEKINKRGLVIKTEVTTGLISRICKQNQVDIIDNLLVGFKYIGEEMNKLTQKGDADKFLLGCEESHGYIGGNYARDKDACPAAIWLAELAAELKEKNETIIDYLEKIYAKYGYFYNYLTEIRLPGAEGMSKIAKILEFLRAKKPKKFGKFEVVRTEDWRDRLPILSNTDKTAKNGLIFYIKSFGAASSIKITIRPSGTEPKIKMYFELSSKSFKLTEIRQVKSQLEKILKEMETVFMLFCYKILGVNFPERGLLLFWQLPVKAKLRYFKVEEKITKLKHELDKNKRQQKLNKLLQFLGSDPIMKVDKAFQAKYKQTIKNYLQLN